MPPILMLIATTVNFVSAVLSVVVWYTAYRAFRFLGSVKILFLSVSFLLFALGLFSETFYAVAGILDGYPPPRLFLGEGYVLYTILMLAGFMVLAFAYSMGEASVGAPLIMAVRPNPFRDVLRVFYNFRLLFEYGAQIFSAALLLYVLVKVYQEYFSRKASQALPIAMGLTLLLIQLLVRIFDLDSSFDYVFASIIQLAGFALIFYAVWKVSSK